MYPTAVACNPCDIEWMCNEGRIEVVLIVEVWHEYWLRAFLEVVPAFSPHQCIKAHYSLCFYHSPFPSAASPSYIIHWASLSRPSVLGFAQECDSTDLEWYNKFIMIINGSSSPSQPLCCNSPICPCCGVCRASISWWRLWQAAKCETHSADLRCVWQMMLPARGGAWQDLQEEVHDKTCSQRRVAWNWEA